MDAFVLHTLFKRLLHRTLLKHLNSRHWLMLFALLPACLGLLGFWRGGWTLALIVFFLSHVRRRQLLQRQAATFATHEVNICSSFCTD